MLWFQMLLRGKRGIDCAITCKNGGTCLYYEDGKKFSCVCPITHCGVACQILNPCMYGGICAQVSSSGRIMCKCIKGTSGPRCSKLTKMAIRKGMGKIPEKAWFLWTTWAVICVTCIVFVLSIYMCRRKLHLPVILEPSEHEKFNQHHAGQQV